MTEYVVHFPRHEVGGASGYEAMLGILADGRIEARSALGAARTRQGLGRSQYSACFAEIPVDQLSRLVERRSSFGIAFRQTFLQSLGGARVWYLDRDGAPHLAVQDLINKACEGELNPADPIWRLTPFIDAPGVYGSTKYRFEWEREWRVPGEVAFQPSDVAFLFLPDSLHDKARKFFQGAKRDHLGPSYAEVTFLDPAWPDEVLQAGLGAAKSAP